jgi:hypothetical protein
MHASLLVPLAGWLVPGWLFGVGVPQPAPAPAPLTAELDTSSSAHNAESGAASTLVALDPDDLSLLAELQAPGMMDRRNPPPPSQMKKPLWPVGHTVMQGFLGAYEFETVETNGGDSPDIDGSDDDLSQLPAIGGGGQWKLLGNRLDFGFEAMISFGWRANATAFAAGGGGAVVAVDVDMFLIDLYGGPFLSVFLGERVRAYGAAGPLMQWSEFDQDGPDELDSDGSGFGTGWYARTGLELRVRPGLMVGGGVRWTDSTIDLDNDMGDLDLEGLQWAFTVSTGI